MSLDDYFVDLDEGRRFGTVDYSNPKQVYKLPEVQEALESSTCQILRILLDGKPHSTWELIMKTGAMRVPARIHELRKMGFPIESKAEGKNPRRWYYRLDIKRLPFPDPLAVVCKRGRARI